MSVITKITTNCGTGDELDLQQQLEGIETAAQELLDYAGQQVEDLNLRKVKVHQRGEQALRIEGTITCPRFTKTGRLSTRAAAMTVQLDVQARENDEWWLANLEDLQQYPEDVQAGDVRATIEVTYAERGAFHCHYRREQFEVLELPQVLDSILPTQDRLI